MLNQICYVLLLFASVPVWADDELPSHEPLISQTCSVVLQNRHSREISMTFTESATHQSRMEARRLAIAAADNACMAKLESYQLEETHFCTLWACQRPGRPVF